MMLICVIENIELHLKIDKYTRHVQKVLRLKLYLLNRND